MTRANACLYLVVSLTVFASVSKAQHVSGVSGLFLFQNFLQEHNKSYAGAEFARRQQIFLDNVNMIIDHNAANHSYKLAVNQFADSTWEEFKAAYLGAAASTPQDCSATRGNHILTSKPAPASVDWRDKGVVSEVKNQGHCGSCWTFSTTGCLEAHHKIQTGKSVLLSEQQLVDCAQAYDNHGCAGGLPSHAFEYITANGGLDTEAAYPYEAKDNTCRFDSAGVGAKIAGGSVNITAGSEDELLDAIAHVGPVSIAYQVVPDFRFYKSGVYTSQDCKNDAQSVNHAVLAVGYGTDAENGDYWIVKNSWGTSFGIDGYFWIKKGVNMCGLAVCASYPQMKASQPIEVVSF